MNVSYQDFLNLTLFYLFYATNDGTAKPLCRFPSLFSAAFSRDSMLNRHGKAF